MGSSNLMTFANLVILILTIAALIWLLFAIRQLYLIRKIRTWPITEAVVVDSSVGSQSGGIGDYRLITEGVDRVKRFYPKVTYEYNIGGRVYRSNNVIFGANRYYTAAEIKALMTKLQPGSHIPVHYNPSNVRESFIDAGVESYRGIIVPLILLALLSAFGWWYNSRLWKAEVRESKGLSDWFRDQYNQLTGKWKTTDTSDVNVGDWLKTQYNKVSRQMSNTNANLAAANANPNINFARQSSRPGGMIY